MKKPLRTLMCITIMLFVSSGAIAQGAMKVAVGTDVGTMKVAGGTNVKVQTATMLKVTDDFNISIGADVDIYGDVTVAGTVTCTDATA